MAGVIATEPRVYRYKLSGESYKLWRKKLQPELKSQHSAGAYRHPVEMPLGNNLLFLKGMKRVW
ncbi:hypothetical protein [Jeotgalibacillus haloalkalitolerans]|uniref:Uncharacterized protein n=1 Tax=Jeotgalibacillus haloalkalitolerans TaxID=3104292 RepID=A0ABU5KHU4_9BACL|nr:hypothetical protein [Jeotgalibacillus sp. HH7-29]MDZ5710817.1 hypothetical protein [Jeotgalibacillus sp. HH7-29]